MSNEIITIVEKRVETLRAGGQIFFPENYAPENALKSAYLVLKNTKDRNKQPVLESCTQSSIASSLLDMVVQGLSPAKKQCYFIAYGKMLSCMRSYFGTMAVTKRLKNVLNIRAEVVREGESFKFERRDGIIVINEHSGSIGSLDSKIVAAYCVIELAGDINHIEIMSREQIEKSWEKSDTYKLNGKKNKYGKEITTPHIDFEDQMCKRTVIDRACKYYANSSDDSDLLIEAFNRTGETPNAEKELSDEIDNQASEAIDAPDAPEAPPTPETPKKDQKKTPASKEKTPDWMDV